MKKIAIIPARSGSKGLKNKNMLLAGGKPLIAYSIEAALEYGQFEKIIVSTDSEEYISDLQNYPIDFVHRAEDLASDTASSFVVIEDVLEKYADVDFSYFVLLQPTSPLRTSQHIKEACFNFEEKIEMFDFSVSVSHAGKPTTLTRPIDDDHSLKYFDLDYSNYTRQNEKTEYSPNGAIFIGKPVAYLEHKHFYGKKSLAYYMDKEYSLDIDTVQDFEYFYFILQQNRKQEILQQAIKNRISVKKEQFSKISPITLIGHFILDQWECKELKGYSVNNLGISGINSEQYFELILESGLLSDIGDIVFIMQGTNDIVCPNFSDECVAKTLQKSIDVMKGLNPNVEVIMLETLPVSFRRDRDNEVIKHLNQTLRNRLTGVKWIDLYATFLDKYSKLDLRFTHDGLHLNENGYDLLKQVIEANM